MYMPVTISNRIVFEAAIFFEGNIGLTLKIKHRKEHKCICTNLHRTILVIVFKPKKQKMLNNHTLLVVALYWHLDFCPLSCIDYMYNCS